MRSGDDNGYLNNGTTHEKTDRPPHHLHHNRAGLGKPTPSKWDDAQKWLVNLSRGEKNPAKASPRNSNADDLRLIARVPKMDYSSGEDDEEKNDDVETKNVVNNSPYTVVRPICLRDMGTEMTPITSQEPSRSATPVRVTSPASSSPVRCPKDGAAGFKTGRDVEKKECDDEPVSVYGIESKTREEHSGKMNPLEIKAMAWEEAERAKYTARFKREEVKIQAWENHKKRKAEMENRKVEIRAERMKSRAQEKCNSNVAAARRMAEEKRANAEAKLQEKAMKTSESADYIRRNGHIPFCISFKLPSFCCW